MVGKGRLKGLDGTYDLPLLDKMRSVELSDDGLEDFVSDGGKDSLVVVLSEVLWGDKSERKVWDQLGSYLGA